MITLWGKSDPATYARALVPALEQLIPPVPWRIVEPVNDEILKPGPGEVVIAMGKPQYEALAKAGFAQKGRSVDSLRGKPILHKSTPLPGMEPTEGHGYGWWMLTYAPGMIHVDAGTRALIAWDIRLAHRWLTTGSLKPVLGEYSFAPDLTAVLDYIDWHWATTGERLPISVDLETEGFFPWYDDKNIVSMQVTVVPGVADVIDVQKLRKGDPEKWQAFLLQVRHLLNDDRVSIRGANFKFDLVWIAVKWKIECTNFRMDTTAVGSLLDENRSNSLNWHAKEHTMLGGYDDEFNAKHDKGTMGSLIVSHPEEFVVYSGGDTDAALQVSEVQVSALKSQPMVQRFYVKLLHPALRTFEKIERRGMVVDQAEYARLRTEVTETMDMLEKKAIGMLPGRIRVKHSDKLDLTRKAIISDFLFTPMGLNLKPLMVTDKTGAPKTDKAHMQMFEDHPDAGPFIKALNAWNSAQKIRGTYIDGFLKHIRPDGMFHPTYMLFNGDMFDGESDQSGTVTGRLAAKNPAVQTIPKHDKGEGEYKFGWAKKLRRVFTAPPGMVCFQVDFSQGELRITACVADEKTMIEAYANGMDLHCVTGAKLAGFEYGEFIALSDGSPDQQAIYEKFRSRAKPANFGLLYGMKEEGYKEYARTAYKVHLTLEEAYEQRGAFFDLYSGLTEWHRTYKNFAKREGWVASPLGRVRHLPLISSRDNQTRSSAERQAINSPIQSTLSDLCIWSATLLEDLYAEEGLWIAGMTHDSLYGYVPEDEAEDWMKKITDVMVNLPIQETFGWYPQLRFPADAEIGANMADLKKVKLS